MQQYLMIHGHVRFAVDKRALLSAIRFYHQLLELSVTATVRENATQSSKEDCPILLSPFRARYIWLRDCMNRTTSTRSKVLPGKDGFVSLEVKMLQGDGKRNVGDIRIVFSKEGAIVVGSSTV